MTRQRQLSVLKWRIQLRPLESVRKKARRHQMLVSRRPSRVARAEHRVLDPAAVRSSGVCGLMVVWVDGRLSILWEHRAGPAGCRSLSVCQIWPPAFHWCRHFCVAVCLDLFPTGCLRCGRYWQNLRCYATQWRLLVDGFHRGCPSCRRRRPCYACRVGPGDYSWFWSPVCGVRAPVWLA